MRAPTEAPASVPPPVTLPSGYVKLLGDIWAVLEIKVLIMIRGWHWYLMASLVFPVTMFYWSRALVSDDPETVRRMMTGSIVLGTTLLTANSLASQIIQDRFQHRLKLLITMPMSKVAYAVGVLIFASLMGWLTIGLLLLFGLLAGVEFELTWTFFPVVVPAVLSLAGLTLLIGSYAPSAEVGGIMANLLGAVLVFISPVFFPMERAPLLMQWVGQVSPLRYAADAIMKSLSGRTDIWLELTFLLAFAAATMILGLWKLRWREQ